MEPEIPFVHRRTIIFGDTDPGGIVYTPNFSNYCMEAVEVWFNDYIGVNWSTMNLHDGIGTPIAHMEIDFIGPLLANDILGTVVHIERIGRSSVSVNFEGIRELPDSTKNTTVFKANYVFCFARKGPPPSAIDIPEKYRTRLEEYLQQQQDTA